jgi:hypothetical protein
MVFESGIALKLHRNLSTNHQNLTEEQTTLITAETKQVIVIMGKIAEKCYPKDLTKLFKWQTHLRILNFLKANDLDTVEFSIAALQTMSDNHRGVLDHLLKAGIMDSLEVLLEAWPE